MGERMDSETRATVRELSRPVGLFDGAAVVRCVRLRDLDRLIGERNGLSVLLAALDRSPADVVELVDDRPGCPNPAYGAHARHLDGAYASIIASRAPYCREVRNRCADPDGDGGV